MLWQPSDSDQRHQLLAYPVYRGEAQGREHLVFREGHSIDLRRAANLPVDACLVSGRVGTSTTGGLVSFFTSGNGHSAALRPPADSGH